MEKETRLVLKKHGLLYEDISDEDIYKCVSETLAGDEKNIDKLVQNMKKISNCF